MPASYAPATFQLQSIPVAFPYDAPYQQQLNLMSTVLRALKDRRDAVLESPTGSGKTLALLCASLAYAKEQVATHRRAVTILYASRTHAQLRQVLAEFKTTAFATRQDTHVLTLSSRDATCIHEDVHHRRGTDQIAACRGLVSVHKCAYKENVDMAAKANMPQAPALLEDLEDLGSFRALRSKGLCPYFLARARPLVSHAELILLPYAYLLDAVSRRSVSVDWKQTVVIFDEAHNLEAACEEESEFELGPSHFSGSLLELEGLMRKLRDGPAPPRVSLSISELASTHAALGRLGKAWEAYCAKAALVPREARKASPGDLVFDLLKQAGVGRTHLLELRRHIASVLEAEATSLVSMRRLEHIYKCLTRLMSVGINVAAFEGGLAASSADASEDVLWAEHFDEAVARCAVREAFRCFVDSDDERTPWKFQFWCFRPSLAIDTLRRMGVNSFVFASGTLAPLDAFVASLGLDAGTTLRLENAHVVPESRFLCATVRAGLQGEAMDCSFRGRAETFAHVGGALVELSKRVPDGLLVFFQSHKALQDCVRLWHRTGAYKQLLGTKSAILIETSEGNIAQLMSSYDSAVESGLGALLLAVCRGRLSEGMDFKDARARCVVLVGLPFPNSTDPRTIEKKAFLDSGPGGLAGTQWFFAEAFKAVNQAAGRVLRHRDDFGAIILMDERFGAHVGKLSKWLRPGVTTCGLAGEALEALDAFFRRMGGARAATAAPAARAPAAASWRSVDELLAVKRWRESASEAAPQGGGASAAFEVRQVGSGQSLRPGGAAPPPPLRSAPLSDRLVAQSSEAALDTSQYVLLIQRALGRDAYDEFIGLVKRLKAAPAQSNMVRVRDRMRAIFKGVDGGASLLNRFLASLPAELRQSLQA